MKITQSMKHMEIQRTNSVYLDNTHEDMKNRNKSQNKEQVTLTEMTMSLNLQNRTRMPNSLLQTLRSKGPQDLKKSSTEEDMKQSKLGLMINSKIKEFRNMYTC